MTAGIAVSLLCLYFATRGTDWSRVGGVLAGAHPGWVGALALACVGVIYVRAQRWRVLLRPFGQVPLYPTLSATAIGFGASAVLPFRIGELVRPALLGRRIGIGMSAALSTVVLERVFDVLLVIACLFAVSLAYPLPSGLRSAALVLAVFTGLGFVALLIMQRSPARAEAIIERLLARFPARAGERLRPLIHSFLSGLGSLGKASSVALVLAYSVYLWTIIMLTFLFGFLALRIDVPLVPASLTAVVIVAAFVFLPQAPGFVGTWQAGCVLALDIFGVQQDVAVGYSLLTWLVSIGVTIGAAVVFLVREDVSFGQLLRVARDPTAAGAEG